MRTLVIVFAVTLFFIESFVWVHESTGGESDLSQEIQSILNEIKEQSASGKNFGDMNLSGEAKVSQKKAESTDQLKLPVKPALDIPPEKRTESSAEPIDLLERAAIRYRNMIENINKGEDSARGSMLYFEKISDELKAAEKEEAILTGMNIVNPLKPDLTDKTVESGPSRESKEQAPNQFSAITGNNCQELKETLEAISARLDTIHKGISDLNRH